MGGVLAEPFCFLQAAEITSEIDALCAAGSPAVEREAAKDIFAKDRRCPSWYRYNSGFSPKDHFDQMTMELLEQSRREFELRLEKGRKDFDLKLFDISQKVQEDSRKIAERSDSFNRRMTFFFIVLASLELFATVASLAFPNGIPWLVNLFSGS